MQKHPRSLLMLVILLALPAVQAIAAGSSIYRCIGEDDVPIFTDRKCSSHGARDPLVQASEPIAPVLPVLTQGCPRGVEMLQVWVRAALESGDVNHLSGLYHWTEATAEMAEKVMPELEIIARRHLLDIKVESVEIEGVHHPAWLWLYQYDPKRPGETVRTGFRLVKSAGCWWLHG